MGTSFHFRGTRLGLLALGGVLAAMAVGPATASATHFTGSTKQCAEQNPTTKTFDCVLTVKIDSRGFTSSDPLIISIQSSAVGAEFAGAPTRSGGTCTATTSLTLLDATTVRVSPSSPLGTRSCTLVFQETLTADDFGEVCQLLDTVANAPTQRVCAQLLPPSLPTAKEQCKEEGFKVFTAGFKNQGDCVSFVATQGKNEPGKNMSSPEGL